MARLRGGSTAGGKQLVTLDVMNDFIYQIQTEEMNLRLKKYEKEKLNTFDKANTYINNREYNGFYQMNNAVNNDGKYGYGQLLNLSNESARFQMYAPHNESGASALYFRTGWDNDVKSWERVASKNMLDTGLNLKFNKTGGDISGNVLISGTLGVAQPIRTTSSSKYTEISATDSTFATYNTNHSAHKFNAPIYSTGEIFANNNSKVWHAGNLTPDDYVSRTAELLAAGTDLNTIKRTGFYRCSNAANRPSKISNWCYIEIIRHDDNYILQKAYSYDGNHAYWRVLDNGTWKSWRPLGGGLNHTATITSNSWSLVDGVYEMSITHNIGFDNITSVIVTDSNGVSMFTGFQTLDINRIKVFCSTNPAGKVVINAIQ